MFERVKENFFKKIRLKDAILSFILALILLFFSQHLFLDSGYWVEKGIVPDFYNIKFLYKGAPSNLKIDSYTPDAAYCYMGERIKDKNVKSIALTLYDKYHTYKFKLGAENIDKIEIWQNSMLDKAIEFKSIKINNKELLSSKQVVSADEKFEYKLLSENSIYNIEITCKRKISNYEHPFKIHNGIVFTLLFLFYYAFGLRLFLNITSIKNITSFLKKYKVEIIILILFFSVYALYNFKAALLVNHFNRPMQSWNSPYWISGDALIVIRDIFCAESKQFHPYFFLPLYPLYEFLMFISKGNLYFSLSIIWCFLGSLSGVFLYKTLNLIIPKLKVIKTIILLCFIFTLSQLLMSYIFDLYIIAGCYLSVCIYLIFKELKNKEYNFSNIFLIILICAFIFGVNMVNIITCLIVISSLFLVKKNKKTAILFLLALFLLISFFTLIKAATDEGETFKSLTMDASKMQKYIKTDIALNYDYFKKETILNPLIYSNKPITNPALIFWALFVLTTVFASYLYLSNKAKDDNKALYFSLLAAILYNFCANFFWCPKMGFLFSQNFLVLLFIIMAMSINNIDSYLKTKKYSNCFKYSLIICLAVLLFFEITLNTKTVLRQHNNAIKYNPQNLLLEKR